MGRKCRSFITLLSSLLVGYLLLATSMVHITEARLLLSSGPRLHEDVREIVKGLSLAAVKKSGPSSGKGHRYKNLQTLGVVKHSGPSHGEGYRYENFQTLGVVKHSGPSPGEGHEYVTGNNP
ncbi:hypothetical protein MANES_10G076931v8 [Manihot esculenta]|uniref:Uncharacterized protein n=2 Tax=Manihot esculenta TaxID=3983 RepID=A0ACB7H071_MANES|nr:hypothetical protein MANES_10G076931v8 [Manihot esculenta]